MAEAPGVRGGSVYDSNIKGGMPGVSGDMNSVKTPLSSQSATAIELAVINRVSMPGISGGLSNAISTSVKEGGSGDGRDLRGGSLVSRDMSSVKNTIVITVGNSDNRGGNDQRGSMPGMLGGMTDG